MTKHYCDKCEKELPVGIRDNVKIGAYELIHEENGTEYESFRFFRYEICQECAEEVIQFITGESIPMLD